MKVSVTHSDVSCSSLSRAARDLRSLDSRFVCSLNITITTAAAAAAAASAAAASAAAAAAATAAAAADNC